MQKLSLSPKADTHFIPDPTGGRRLRRPRMAGYDTQRRFTYPRAVTHPTSNRGHFGNW